MKTYYDYFTDIDRDIVILLRNESEMNTLINEFTKYNSTDGDGYSLIDKDYEYFPCIAYITSQQDSYEDVYYHLNIDNEWDGVDEDTIVITYNNINRNCIEENFKDLEKQYEKLNKQYEDLYEENKILKKEIKTLNNDNKFKCECCNKIEKYSKFSYQIAELLLPIGMGEYDKKKVVLCNDCFYKIMNKSKDEFYEIKGFNEK